MALEADALVVVASHGPLDMACDELQWRIRERKQAQYIRLPAEDIGRNCYGTSVCRLLDELEDVAFVCVTDTLLLSESIKQHGKERERAKLIYRACRTRKIPINVADMPEFCDFTFPSTNRFNPSHPTPPVSSSSSSSTSPSGVQSAPPLQIAVTTNGQGCRLAGRIRREISTKLHPKLGDAAANVARLRTIAKNYHIGPVNGLSGSAGGDREEDEGALTSLNAPVRQIGAGGDAAQVEKAEERNPMERVARRMRWVNQISEYWPVEKLAALKEDEMQAMLDLGADGTAVTRAGANGAARSRDSHLAAPAKVEILASARETTNSHVSGEEASCGGQISGALFMATSCSS